ncbi:properdin-like [Leucoraja erinacea]|uniref:properdin-like n=1 Tax=Leucoraja erinaceus TaxID=7782 RepID=UPI002457637F|nr:properdin-like [Leucoraja erinacea]
MGRREAVAERKGGERNTVATSAHTTGSIPEKCFDVSRCSFDAYVWTAWGEWGLCQPPCGPDSRRTRRRTCLPVYEDEIDESVTITGSPRLKCVELEGRRDVVTENRTCLNVPTCLAVDFCDSPPGLDMDNGSRGTVQNPPTPRH